MHSLKITVFILMMILFTACGGGGGGGNPGNPGNPGTGSNNWDQMIWDQDQWG